MKKTRKLMLTLAAFLLMSILALSACGGNNNDGGGNGGGGDQPPAVTNGGGDTGQQVELPPERDLQGLQINIANWWTDECTDTIEPDSFAERARWDDRRALEQRYNFRMRYVRYGSWHDVRDDVQQVLLAQDRAYQFWVVEPTWFATHHRQGLFAPIPDHFFQDDFGIEWNESLIDATRRDGNPHGFAHGVAMAGGVYFNQRLLEEAGQPRDLPFTLQRDNNWTWDTFTELARHLSRDLTGDGIIDTWAITTFHSDMLAHALASNNAAYAMVDPVTGRFVNTSNTDAFREAIEWMVSLRDEMLVMHEDDVGGEWNVFIQMFNDGQGAMRIAGNYVAGNIINELADDWGFVAFPRGPRSDRHYAWVSQNINIIPHFYTADEVEEFMWAMQRWIRPLEDDDPYDWIDENMTNHRDPRSVEETMMYFTRNPDLQIMPAHLFMSGLGNTLGENFAWRLWVGNDPAVIVEEAQLVWGAFIDDINALN